MSTAILHNDVVSQIDGHLREQRETFGLLDSRVAKVESENAKIWRGLSELNEKGTRIGLAPGSGGTSLGQQFTGSEHFKQFASQPRSQGRSVAVEVKISGPFLTKAATIGPLGSDTSPRILPSAPGMPLRLRQFLPSVAVASGSVVYVSESGEVLLAGIQSPEGAVKAVSTITLENKTVTVLTTATTLKCSEQALADVEQLQVFIDGRLAYAVLLREEQTFINGDVPTNTPGLLTAATAADGSFVPTTGATALDAIAGAIAQLGTAGFIADCVIVSSKDWLGMATVKNTQGGYIWADPGAPREATPSVWGTPICVSPGMPAGQFIVAALAQATTLFDRQSLIVQVGVSEDDFVRNLLTLRAEVRSVLTIPVAAGIIRGVFPVSPAALAAPHAPVPPAHEPPAPAPDHGKHGK